MSLRLRMQETNEYDRLVQFFVENQLEFDGDEEVDTDIIKCYKVTHGDDHLVGAAVLAEREGQYIIDGIAVEKIYRKMKVGEILLKKVIGEVKKREGKRLYLVARAPEFFKKYGFVTVNPEEAPNFFECKYCPQYQVDCFPEVLKLEI